MLIKTKAVVLNSFKYTDNRLIVDLFTLDMGRMAVAVNVSTGKKSKFPKSIFTPLTLLDIEADMKQRQGLQKLREASMSYAFTSIPFRPEKATVALFISDFLYHALKGEQDNASLFIFISDSIKWFDLTDNNVANFHIVFLLRLTLFLGFMPNFDHYTEGCFFDLRGSTFVNTIPPHHDFLDIRESAIVSTMMRMNYRTMHLFHLTRSQRNRLLDVLVAYYRLHLPDFPELKSLEVLRSVYS